MNLRRLWVCSALALTYGPLALYGQTRKPTHRVLAAEADTVVVGPEVEGTLSHWKLWRLSEGGYEVEDRGTETPTVIQRFRFDSQMIPLGYSVSSAPKGRGARQKRETAWTISCQYKTAKLVCSGLSEGKWSIASVSGEQPFVVTLEFYRLDLPWYMTGVVQLATQKAITKGTVNTYLIEDGADPETIKLVPDEPMEILPVHEQSAGSTSGANPVTTFECVDGDDLSILRVDKHGQVISMTEKSDPQSGMFSTRNYKEYLRWGLDSSPAKSGPR